MLRSEEIQYRDPKTQVRLSLRVDVEENGQVVEGALVSPDGDTYAVVRGIPRFCPVENYAESFGFQWQKYDTVQLDSKSQWGSVSEKRFFGESGWPRDMKGQRILEAGSGMGRFTEHLAGTGAEICTFDYSAAVDANRRNNGRFGNISFAQADIYNPPYEHGSFDRVVCIGVLQHCPSPKRAFLSLTRFLRPGGHIFVDSYKLYWGCFVLGKYWMRPVTRNFSPQTLHKFVRFHVGWVYPLTGALQKVIGRRGRSFSWLLGMSDYRGVHGGDDATQRQLSMLDTFDMLAPKYDRPATTGMIRRWFDAAGLIDCRIAPGSNGWAATGRRPG